MEKNSIIILNFWDLLQYKIWDQACEAKGYDKDFIFGSVYDNNYEFEFTKEELNDFGVRLN
ncbi:MAG: hypothetical protein C0594_16880 [Marinilabiliales bacterium]|nr:MAG: hypothetical protein C0594_16880 [Marinilabiliales bacterium]